MSNPQHGELARQVAELTVQVTRLATSAALNAQGIDTLEATLEELQALSTRHAHAVRELDEGAHATALDSFALHQRLGALEDTAHRALAGLDDLESALDTLAPAPGVARDDMAAAMAHRARGLAGDAGGPVTPTPHTDSVPNTVRTPTAVQELIEWAAEHVAPLVRKATVTGEGAGIRWCRQWWRHRDARDRIEALRGAFVELGASAQDSPSWWSVYLRDHLDPHLTALTHPTGPFYACTPRRHSDAFDPLGQDSPDPETTPEESHYHTDQASGEK